MKVICKTVAGASADVEVEPTDTLAELKTKVEAAMPSLGGPVGKLIHMGKVLEEGKPISSYGVADGQTFVVMVNKPKPAAPVKAEAVPAAATPATPAAAAPAAAAAAAPAAPAGAPAAAAPSAAASAGAAPAVSYEASASALVTGSELEQTVMQIMEMGFERDQVMKAMQAAFNNPERAVEYLMTGIPAGVGPAPPAAGAAPAHPPTGAPSANPAPQTGAGGPLDFLRNHPQFIYLRGLVQARPEMLQPLMEQLAQVFVHSCKFIWSCDCWQVFNLNLFVQTIPPEILQAIQENQEEFIRILNEPVDQQQLLQANMQMQVKMLPGPVLIQIPHPFFLAANDGRRRDG